MYVTSEATFTGPGVGGPGFGLLTASACLQNITVMVQCLTTVSGTPTVALDLQFGDNQNVNLSGNQDRTFSIGALPQPAGVTIAGTTGFSWTFTGVCALGARVNVTWGTPGGSFKVQVAARDIN